MKEGGATGSAKGERGGIQTGGGGEWKTRGFRNMEKDGTRRTLRQPGGLN